jgi:hypothetical protein
VTDWEKCWVLGEERAGVGIGGFPQHRPQVVEVSHSHHRRLRNGRRDHDVESLSVVLAADDKRRYLLKSSSHDARAARPSVAWHHFTCHTNSPFHFHQTYIRSYGIKYLFIPPGHSRAFAICPQSYPPIPFVSSHTRARSSKTNDSRARIDPERSPADRTGQMPHHGATPHTERDFLSSSAQIIHPALKNRGLAFHGFFNRPTNPERYGILLLCRCVGSQVTSSDTYCRYMSSSIVLRVPLYSSSIRWIRILASSTLNVLNRGQTIPYRTGGSEMPIKEKHNISSTVC